MVNDRVNNRVLMKNANTAAPSAFSHRGGEIHLLRDVIRTHQALMSAFSREVGIPASRFQLMRLLAATENGLGVMEVARQLGINAAAVTRQVKELERDHLAQRRSDPKDGRRSFVRLSARGRKLFEGIHERSHALERALEKVIRPEEMSSAIAVLQKLRWFLLSVRCSHSTAVAGDWTLELSGLSAELTGENGNENA